MAEIPFIVIVTVVGKALAQSLANQALNDLLLASGYQDLYFCCGFKGEGEKLEKKFERIQALLRDAPSNSNHEGRSEQVKLWVQHVKDAVYDADDVLDEYAIEMDRKKRFNKRFRGFFTLSNPVIFRLRMAKNVSKIKSLFEEIDEEAMKIRLKLVGITAVTVTQSRNEQDLSQIRKHAGASLSEFVGREVVHGKLLDRICSPLNERCDLSIVAIVGMGGVGKTTLARRLYDNEEISRHFSNGKVWIFVSQDFDIDRFLSEIAKSLPSKSDMSNTGEITSTPEEKLEGKKLLLVLDDVWKDNQDLWDTLRDTLTRIRIAPGSVILITTRSDEVVLASRAEKHKLEGLSNEESWTLFCQKLLNNSSFHDSDPLQKVGKRIVEKCGGVPLAIKVIRGLLESEQRLGEWEKIEKSELWNSAHGRNGILPSLLLSFNHLGSASVQQCFAYFGVIPKGRMALKSELFGLWLAQGYLRTEKQEIEIAEENLQELLRNSLFEECVSEKTGIMGYKMHDLVHDLAVYVCGKDLIKDAIQVCETGGCRHLLMNPVENKPISDVQKKSLRKLRTLDLKGPYIPWDVLNHTRVLRTLTLDRTGVKELPAAVALLKHLRFLDVSYNPISTLPDSIGKLYQLQTLVLQGCNNMKKLPKVVNKLVNLRYISTTAPMFAYKGLHQLTNLQSLPRLSLDGDGEGWRICELGDLHELRDEIYIQGLECVKEKDKARKAGLSGKANVTKLNLSWVEGRSESSGVIYDEDVLEGLEPHPNITSLIVQSFFGVKFPTWVTEMAVLTVDPRGNQTRLNNLTEVKLLNCRKCVTLPKLGQLPLLKCLILSGLDVEVIGSEFYGGGDLRMPAVPFKCLRELEISEFSKLVTWMEPPEVAFPCLETLRIRECRELKAVPALGSRSLTSLELETLHSVETLDIIKYTSGLTSLIMRWLTEITSLPQELANCTKLQILEIISFTKLASLHITSLVNLQSLKVLWCNSLVFIRDDLLHNLASLHILEIVCCASLRKIPSSLEECTSLETLYILHCPLTEFLSTIISNLQRLQELRATFSSAEHLRSVLEVAQHLPLLHRLEIKGFRDDNEMGEYFSDMTPFLSLPSLTHLMLGGHPNIKNLPQQLGLLTRIKHLYIWDFDNLEEIPEWIGNLSSLVYLFLADCKNLERLPSQENLQRLTYLCIDRCPKLSERYEEGGLEWNTSHINLINMDGKTIQHLNMFAS